MTNSPHVTIPYLEIEKYVELIKGNRLNLEIYLSADALDSMQEGSVHRVKELLDYGPALSIHGPYMDMAPAAVDRAIRQVVQERFRRTCGIARSLGARTVVFHSGFDKWKYSGEVSVWLRESIKTWRMMLDSLEGSDVHIAVENIFEENPSNLLLLLEAIPSKQFGLCFDTGHFHLFSKVTLQEWLNKTKDRTYEFHLHDNTGKADEHLPIGAGSFNFQEFFETVKGWDCVHTIEGHSKESVLQSLAYLAGNRYLR